MTDLTAIPLLVDRLRQSWNQGRTRSVAWRISQLSALERLCTERADEILQALAEDVGKPHMEAYSAEQNFMVGEIRHAKKKLSAWMKPEKVSTPLVTQPGTSRIIKDPLGVVLVIAPWNYPFQLAMSPAVGAIAAGNCVIIKPSEVAPATSALIAKYIPQYLDQECIAVVEGGIPETTALLEQRFDYIFYTGNGHVGRIVMTAAAKNLTPVTLELGGKSPAIIDKDIDLEITARRLAWGKFFNAGQTCVAPDYVLVHHDRYDELIHQLKTTITQFYGADPQKSTDYARVVNARHHQRLMKLLDGKATIFHGGRADESDRYLEPTILTNIEDDAACMADEIFGPILPVIPVDSIDLAIAEVNARPKPLALYVFTRNDRVADQVIARTSSGGATVNHVWLHLAVPGLPFGGVGESGMGGYHGHWSFDTFSHRKSVLRKPMAIDPALMYPPYTQTKTKWLKRFL